MSTATMTPTHTVIETSVGPLTLVSTGSIGGGSTDGNSTDGGSSSGDWAPAGLYFPQHLRRPSASSFGRRTDDGFSAVREQLGEYSAGARTTFDVPL